MKCPEIWEHKCSMKLDERAWIGGQGCGTQWHQGDEVIKCGSGTGATKGSVDSNMATTTTKTHLGLKSTKIRYSWSWNREWGDQKYKNIFNFDISAFLDVVYILSESIATEIKWHITQCSTEHLLTDHGGYACHTPRNSWVLFSCTEIYILWLIVFF